MEGQTVTVIGIAQNGKDGALVLTEAGEAYYVDGLSAWDEKMHRKQVGVTGILKIETFNEENLVNEKGERSAGTTGMKKIIQQATWGEMR